MRALEPRSVLDAGCGTGRVAIELARHGVDVVGVDVDSSMIAEARRRAPDQAWLVDDLVELSLGREFDVVVLAGNVPLFARPGNTRRAGRGMRNPRRSRWCVGCGIPTRPRL